MNVDRLYEGQIFKNYKVMCEELDLPSLAGNSKKRQLSELKRYCALNQSGHSLTVTEVFDEPAPELAGRGSKSIYGDLLQLLFTDYFIGLDRNNVTLTRNTLLNNMKMVNENYQYGAQNVPYVSSYTKIDPLIVHDFFNTTRGSFKYMIESTLDALRDRSLIMYDKVIVICRKNGEHSIADYNEREIILQYEKEALEKLGYDEVGQVIASKNWNRYKSLVQSGIEKHDISYYYSSYDIVINKVYIESDHNKMLDSVLDRMKRSEKKEELNKVICERLEKNANKRRDNTKLESTMYDARNIFSYDNDNKRLINLLVDFETEERLK